MAKIIDGRGIADRLLKNVAAEVRRLESRHHVRPTLAVVLIGDDPASRIYVGRKISTARQVGIRSVEHRRPHTCSEQELLTLVASLNADPAVHGILIQLPLPPQIRSFKVLGAIEPSKDVDGFHPVNVGRLSTGTGGLVPCTPLGCMLLLRSEIDDFRGLSAIVIGKSNIVGKPIAMLLLEAECTVGVTHILTKGIRGIVRKGDIVVAAAGSPGLVRGDWVKPGAIVIDVGINEVTDTSGRRRIVGDVVLDEMDHARAATPVPGGVGPMTIACLMANTATAAGTLLKDETPYQIGLDCNRVLPPETGVRRPEKQAEGSE